MKKNIAVGMLGMALAASASASIISIGQTVNTVIPEQGVGLVNTINVVAPGAYVQDVNVWLDLGAAPQNTAWTGDYYVQLTHGSALSVLLNRTGRQPGMDDGYGPNGFRINLDDQAATDVHWFGDNSPVYNADGQVTGSWQPDARLLDPAGAVGDFPGDPRSAKLSGFNGLLADGDWNLYLYDASGGFVGQLNEWRLDIAVSTALPDSSLGGVGFSAILIGGLLALARRRSWVHGN